MHEVEQLRMELCKAQRSLPRWQIVREGQGKTARAMIHLLERGSQIRLSGSDTYNAVLAAMLTRNAMPRSINEWRKIFVRRPSLQISRRELSRTIPQRYAANRVIERMKLDGKTMGYRIRGQCLPIIGWH